MITSVLSKQDHSTNERDILDQRFPSAEHSLVLEADVSEHTTADRKLNL